MAAAHLAFREPEGLEIGDAAPVVGDHLTDVVLLLRTEGRHEPGQREAPHPVDPLEGVGGRQQIAGHGGVVERRPRAFLLVRRGPQVGRRADLVVAQAGAEVRHTRHQRRVVVDQLAVQVQQEGLVQQAVVVGVGYDESGGERVGGVHHHPALARVDLEHPQRVGQPLDLRPDVRLLDTRRQALADRALRPLLPGDRRAAEVERQVPLQGQVQGQEAQPVAVLAAGHPAVEPQRHRAGSRVRDRRQLRAVRGGRRAVAGPVRHERVRDVGEVRRPGPDLDRTDLVAVHPPVQA